MNSNFYLIFFFFFQITDNHVIKYIPPEEFDPPYKPYSNISQKKNLGCLMVGAESTDPQKVFFIFLILVFLFFAYPHDIIFDIAVHKRILRFILQTRHDAEAKTCTFSYFT